MPDPNFSCRGSTAPLACQDRIDPHIELPRLMKAGQFFGIWRIFNVRFHPGAYVVNPEQHAARLRRLVSAARALLSLQVGVYVGARRLEIALQDLEHDYSTRHAIFAAFTAAVPLDIPVGTARLYWDPEVMLRSDARLADVEMQFRSAILKECAEIIRRYG